MESHLNIFDNILCETQFSVQEEWTRRRNGAPSVLPQLGIMEPSGVYAIP
jgi:hypothetical protein